MSIRVWCTCVQAWLWASVTGIVVLKGAKGLTDMHPISSDTRCPVQFTSKQWNVIFNSQEFLLQQGYRANIIEIWQSGTAYGTSAKYELMAILRLQLRLKSRSLSRSSSTSRSRSRSRCPSWCWSSSLSWCWSSSLSWCWSSSPSRSWWLSQSRCLPRWSSRSLSLSWWSSRSLSLS